jgi:hypothetical protein
LPDPSIFWNQKYTTMKRENFFFFFLQRADLFDSFSGSWPSLLLLCNLVHNQGGSSRVTWEPLSSVSANPGIMAWMSERLLVIHKQSPSEETLQIYTTRDADSDKHTTRCVTGELRPMTY